MKIHLQNTTYGLIPISDQDYNEKHKLKIGETYTAEIKKMRNLRFHRKFFALINCTWDCITEEQKEFFKTAEILRKTLQLSAGHCERIFSITKNEFQDVPLSIAFDKMDDTEFEDLYNRIKDVIFNYVLKGRISEKDFYEHLINF